MKYLLAGQETDRLMFRLLKLTDFDNWVEFFNSSDSSEYLGMQDIESPFEQTKEWFRRMDERYKNDRGGMNALIDKKSNDFIGQCGLLIQEVDGLTEMEIAYSIIPRY